jgi:cell division protein FtsB
LNKGANTYWVDDRLRAQRVAPRVLPALPQFSPASEISRDLIIGTRDEIRRRGGLVPAWVIVTMIVASTFALGLSVNVRSHKEVKEATQQFEAAVNEVAAMRETNAALAREVQLLQQGDVATIEAAARIQLGMVRPNEIVMPVDPR